MPLGLAFAGVVAVLSGVIGYFLVVLGMPSLVPLVRNHAMPNWALVAVGLLLSLAAVRRAAAGRKTIPRLILGVNTCLAGLFAAFLYVALAVPAAGGPAVGAAAPDFSLVDQTGRTVRLADFRGSSLLLVFYRGHW